MIGEQLVNEETLTALMIEVEKIINDDIKLDGNKVADQFYKRWIQDI